MHHLTCGISSLLHAVLPVSLTYYYSLDLSIQTSQIFSFIVFLVPFELLSRIMDLDRTKWALALICLF